MLLVSVLGLAACSGDAATELSLPHETAGFSGFVPVDPIPLVEGDAVLALGLPSSIGYPYNTVELRALNLPEHVTSWTWSMAPAGSGVRMLIHSQSVDRLLYSLTYPLDNPPQSVVIWYSYQDCDNPNFAYYVTKQVDYIVQID